MTLPGELIGRGTAGDRTIKGFMHLGSFAEGGVAVLAGVVILPVSLVL
ncbi:MAG: hypothetical protein ABEH66_04420 [Halobacteriales archaeon]